MQVFRRLDALPADVRGSVVAIGNFDGVHLGHQALFAAVRATAEALAAPAAVLTFDPHPRRLFDPALPPFLLASMPVKLDRIARQGMAATFVQRFDRTVAALPAEGFAEEVLAGCLAVRHVVVGEDYRFGARRAGDVDRLRALGRRLGFGVTALAARRDADGGVCSSSRVRAALAEGRPGDAARLLGQPWEVLGRASRGADGTLSVALGGHQRPRPGTYAVAAAACRGRRTRWADAVRATARLRPDGDAGSFALDRGPDPTAMAGVRLRVLGLLDAA